MSSPATLEAVNPNTAPEPPVHEYLWTLQPTLFTQVVNTIRERASLSHRDRGKLMLMASSLRSREGGEIIVALNTRELRLLLYILETGLAEIRGAKTTDPIYHDIEAHNQLMERFPLVEGTPNKTKPRGRGDAGSVKDNIRKRGNKQCPFTKRPKGLDDAHIPNFSLGSMVSRERSMGWWTLAFFFGRDTSDKLWAVIGQPRDTLRNAVLMDTSKPRDFGNGSFDLRPGTQASPHEMEILLHIRDVFDKWPFEEATDGEASDEEEAAKPRRRIQSGYTFTLVTDNPVRYPLPSRAILEIRNAVYGLMAELGYFPSTPYRPPAGSRKGKRGGKPDRDHDDEKEEDDEDDAIGTKRSKGIDEEPVRHRAVAPASSKGKSKITPNTRRQPIDEELLAVLSELRTRDQLLEQIVRENEDFEPQDCSADYSHGEDDEDSDDDSSWEGTRVEIDDEDAWVGKSCDVEKDGLEVEALDGDCGAGMGGRHDSETSMTMSDSDCGSTFVRKGGRSRRL